MLHLTHQNCIRSTRTPDQRCSKLKSLHQSIKRRPLVARPRVNHSACWQHLLGSSTRIAAMAAQEVSASPQASSGSSTWRFREYLADDEGHIADICKDVYGGTDYLPRQLHHLAADQHTILLVAERTDGGKTVDGIVCADRRGNTAFVFGLRVRESTRGTGLGGLLMDALCQLAPPALGPHISCLATVTIWRNIPSQKIIKRQMDGPVRHLDIWPHFDTLHKYEKSIEWPQQQASHDRALLDFIPGARDLLQQDHMASQLLPLWRQPADVEELEAAVVSLRSLQGGTATTCIPAAAPHDEPPRLVETHRGSHIEPWLPFFYDIHPVRGAWAKQQLEAGRIWVLPNHLPRTTCSTASAPSPSTGGISTSTSTSTSTANIPATSGNGFQHNVQIPDSGLQQAEPVGRQGQHAAHQLPYLGVLVLGKSVEGRRQTAGIVVATTSALHSAVMLAATCEPHFICFVDHCPQAPQEPPALYDLTAGVNDAIVFGRALAGAECLVPNA